MKPLTFLRFLPLFLLLTFSLATNGLANKSKEELEARISANLARLTERQKDPQWAIPAQVFAQAKGIVILNSVKAGFIAGAEVGNGIAIVRKADGTWGAPAFIALVNRSFGFQAGVDESVTILCLMTEQSLKIIHHGANVEVGIDLEAAAGPLGAGGELTSATLQKPVLVYSSQKGVFAGASVQAGALIGDKKKNETVYGEKMDAILFSGQAQPTPAGLQFIEALNALAGQAVR
jgi:SH3 domain-containing YSC84-like protein 1